PRWLRGERGGLCPSQLQAARRLGGWICQLTPNTPGRGSRAGDTVGQRSRVEVRSRLEVLCDGVPDAVETPERLAYELAAGRVRIDIASVVEQGGVLAHEVPHRDVLAVEGHRVLNVGVVAGECLLTVEDVQLEQRNCRVGPDLRGCGRDQSEASQLL